jgi:transcriptional regulator with XRE-family HTH domain
MNYDFQAWLKTPVSDDPETILAGKLEYLRLYLTDAMRTIREKAGLTQAQLAEKLGVQQAAVSKLESALKDRKLDSVLHYLQVLDADLLMAVKQGNDLYQVSDNERLVLVDLPEDVVDLASAAGMSLREYLLAAVRSFSEKKVSAIEIFLSSEDSVAVRVRERLEKPLSEIAAELEKAMMFEEGDRRLFAVKNILVGSSGNGGSRKRDAADEDDDEIEMLELAEDLLDKLGEILESSGGK